VLGCFVGQRFRNVSSEEGRSDCFCGVYGLSEGRTIFELGF